MGYSGLYLSISDCLLQITFFRCVSFLNSSMEIDLKSNGAMTSDFSNLVALVVYLVYVLEEVRLIIFF